MVLIWIEGYLSQCTKKVVLNNQETSTTIESGTTTLKQGVPQGLVLDPLIFTLYISPFDNISRWHQSNFHGYANDSQNYLGFKPSIEGSQDEKVHQLENCISEICIWMQDNLLKTKWWKNGTSDTRDTTSTNPNQQHIHNVSDTTIQPTESARNLGIHFDSKLKKWTTHVNKLTSTLYLSLQNIERICNHLDEDTD